MARPTINDGGTDREMTKQEHDEWLEHVADIEARIAAAATVTAAKQSALAKLAALGLTDAEITALLGA